MRHSKDAGTTSDYRLSGISGTRLGGRGEKKKTHTRPRPQNTVDDAEATASERPSKRDTPCAAAEVAEREIAVATRVESQNRRENKRERRGPRNNRGEGQKVALLDANFFAYRVSE